MARKKKLINKTNVPQYAIEHFARCVFDDIRAFYDSEEGQREFTAWKAEQAALKVHNQNHPSNGWFAQGLKAHNADPRLKARAFSLFKP